MRTLLKNKKFKLTFKSVNRVLVTLAPDFKGDKNVQYLSYERLASYGIPDKSANWLEMRLRFRQNGNVIGDKSAIMFTNTFDDERGFLSVNVDRHALIKNAPQIGEYDRIEMYITMQDRSETFIIHTCDIIAI